MPQRSLMMSTLNAFMVMLLIATSLLAASPPALAATSASPVDVSQSLATTDQPEMVESIIGPTQGVFAQTGGTTLWLSRSSGREGDLVHWKATGSFSGSGRYLLLGPCSSMYEGPSMCGRYFRSDAPAPNGREFSGSFYVRDMSLGLGHRPSAFWFQYTSVDGQSGFQSTEVPFTFLPARTPSVNIEGSIINGGSRVTITGLGFTPWGDDVKVRWGGPSGQLLTSIRLQHNAEHKFTTSFVVPNGVSGSVQIYASQSVERSDRSFITRSASITKTVRPNYIDQGTLRLTPSTGPSGQYTAVYGTGFRPYETVDIRWQSDTGPIIGSITVGSDGTYLGRVTTRTGAPGSNRVYATGRTSLYRSMAWYQITSSTPTMVLRTSHSTTQSGAVVTISGSGYQPNELVHIRWISQSGTLLGSVRATSTGSVSGRVTIPQAANKNYQIFATGGTSKRYASVVHQVRNYTMSGRTLVSPNFGPASTVVGVTGSGYGANERVELRWGSMGGPLLGYVTTNSTGTYSGRVTIPSGLAGNYNIVAVGTSTLRYSTAPYTITSAASSGQLNVSHLNVRPGYVILANGTGWTPGQQLELRWNGANGPLMGRLTVRTNGTWSGRITIPTTARPGTYYLYAITPSGFTSVRMTVSGTSIQSLLAPVQTATPTASPTPIASPTPEVAGTPVGTPMVETPDEPVGTPMVGAPEEPVGTPAAETTREVIEEPVGTPAAEPTGAPTEAPIVEPTIEPTVEPTLEPTTEPVVDISVPVLYPETLVVTDQYQVPVMDVCIEATNQITGKIVKACDVTDWQVTDPARDDLRDGRVRLLPGIEAGDYRIELKNMPMDIPVPEPMIMYLDGADGIDVQLPVWRLEPTSEPTAVPVETPTEEPVPTAVPTEPPPTEALMPTEEITPDPAADPASTPTA